MRGNWLEDPETELAAAPAPKHRSRQKSTAPAAPQAGWPAILIGTGIVAFLLFSINAMASPDGELRTAALTALVLGTVTLVALRRMALTDKARVEFSVLAAGLSVKFLGTLARYWASTGVLYSRSDAKQYDFDGRHIAEAFLRHGHMPPGKLVGSASVRFFTGLIYTALPPSFLAAFFVYSWLSFIGLLLFWRAFRRTVDEASSRRYLYFLMFMPSFVYWPSALGKEALVIFTLGLVTYGYARSITGSPVIGAACAGAGLYLTSAVRPHIALVAIIGIGVATVIRKREGMAKGGAIFGIVAILAIGSVVARQASAYFNTNLGTNSVSGQLEKVSNDRTAQGGSQFESQAVTLHNPALFPYAAVTVLFRPFPWESGSIQELITSLEAVAIAVTLAFSMRRSIRSWRRSNAFAIVALVNVIVFIWLFSNFSNFGILARQRTQVSPFLFALMCLPTIGAFQEAQERRRERRRNRSKRRLQPRGRGLEAPAPTFELPARFAQPPRRPDLGRSAGA